MRKQQGTLKFSMISLLVAGTLLGCGGGGDESSGASDDSSNSNTVGGDTPTANSDITDTLFTNTNGDCEQYTGDYTSNVEDIQRSASFTGTISVQSSGTHCIVQSNGIPNHDFNDASASFATNVSEQSQQYEFDASPSVSATVTELSLPVSEAILLNGVKVDLLAAACYGVGNEKTGCDQDQIDNPWRFDPMSSLNRFGTDEHHAHVQPDGTYHYHGNPMAMFEQDCEGGEPSPVIGFAADGFPIYGSCFRDPADGVVKAATSSYQLKSGIRQAVTGYTTPVAGGSVVSNRYDGQFRGDYEYVVALGSLDECNGMTIEGQYGYYVTNAFPWVLNCFKGDVDSSFGANAQIRSHAH
ncbi:YHYH protein [Vibrio maritimus]|uniref:YHYH protein n=1 Tax=Vibrio maritimus TaxID=990268 RepID=UPI001F30716D|nr:YHYH protein [Vibrio maritimus]